MASKHRPRKKSPSDYKALVYGIRPAPSIPTHITVALGIDAADWVREGMWVPVLSSNVGSIMFDKKVSQLFVRFDSGRVYRYDNVPRSVAMLMFYCNSLGVFTHRVLKNKYPTTEVTGSV